MGNIVLKEDEVVLYEGSVSSSEYRGSQKITLTSNKIVFEREKGFFKKEIEITDTIFLEQVKIYNEVAQIKQKGDSVAIQTTDKNITLSFSGVLEARKFTNKAIDAVTGTTLAKRSSNKIKNAFEMIDDTLGLDTRETIKGVLEQGIKGTIINGIKNIKRG